MMEGTYIKLSNVSKTFPGVKALDGIELEIKYGEVHALVGENGAGKSTMIECILNILMSFDSPAIEKQIDYSYSLEYEYAQKSISIIKSGHAYRITADDSAIGRFVRLPKRIPCFHSVLLRFIPERITNFFRI